MHALDGVTNWLQRATIATQNNPSSHDVSGLYAFADQTPKYLAGTVEALFMGEGLIEASASLWRYGMRKMAERGSQVAAKVGANIGTKLGYVFGKATGSAHNIERSTGMLRQLESVGIFDNAAGRFLMNSHLESVYSGTKGILQSNGRYLRESLLMGPNGGLKVESIWEGTKLITVKLLGGR